MRSSARTERSTWSYEGPEEDQATVANRETPGQRLCTTPSLQFRFEGRTPTQEDLDDGEVFDPVTGGYVTSGWVAPAVIVDEDLDEDVD